MNITLKSLEAINFKNHRELEINFGSYNEIRGRNGQGKTAVGEAITWTLAGCDLMGTVKNFDPLPTNYESDKTRVDLLIERDGKPVMFSREVVKGKTTLYINETPKKAGDYNDAVNAILETNSFDLFLSLFNPHYFPTMHWEDQRRMLLSYVAEPLQKEILAKLPKLQVDAFKPELKKEKPDDIEAKHKKIKLDAERAVIAAEATARALEQANELTPAVKTIEEMKAEIVHLNAEIAVKDTQRTDAASARARKIVKERDLKDLETRIGTAKERHSRAKTAESCRTCTQPIADETRQKVLDSINADYKELAKQYKELKAEIDATELPDVVHSYDIDALRLKVQEITTAIQTEYLRLKAVENITAARAELAKQKEKLIASMFILDALKAYRAVEAEQQAVKVQSLFKTLSVILYTENKGDGAKKPTFELEMQDKPYKKLSQGEKALAGLELIKVLREQSGIEVPVFFDGAESFTGDIDVTGQIIVVYATPITQFKVEVLK